MSRGKPNIRSSFAIVDSYNEKFDTESRTAPHRVFNHNSKKKANKSLTRNLKYAINYSNCVHHKKNIECFYSFQQLKECKYLNHMRLIKVNILIQ